MIARPVARVCLTGVPYCIDKFYDYLIPHSLITAVVKGAVVAVPFGGGNKPEIAVVFDVFRTEDCENLKPILSSGPSELILSEEMLGLCLYIKEQTFCTFGDAFRAIIPQAALNGLKGVFFAPTDDTFIADIEKTLPTSLRAAYNLLLERGELAENEISASFGKTALSGMKKLVKNGYAGYTCEFCARTNIKFTEYVAFSDGTDPEALLEGGRKAFRSQAQLDIIVYLAENGKTELKFLLKTTGAKRQQINALVSKGILCIEKTDLYRTPDSPNNIPAPAGELNPEQKEAYSSLKRLYESGKPCAALLRGITGSGKTRVIKELTDRVLADGRQVIILVPEISLTPQTLSLFSSYYGDNIALLHSSLSAGEKFDAWRRMKSGEVSVCIGTRSAVFAPFDNLGMIVIDEEQEHTYKSDQNPKYHARDVARFRCAKSNALMLLSSATPSMESSYKAECGIYSLVRIDRRFGDQNLPDTIIADLREDYREGNTGAVGSILKKELCETVKRGEQAILFLNRRGYNNCLTCPSCGHTLMCPACSVSLTFHRDGSLRCHYCGHTESPPDICPECGSEHMLYLGSGTQRVEDELSQFISPEKILRMDADTTSTKHAYDEILGSFRSSGASVLLGTQMVTKGHDFPRVSLSGVLLADMSLYQDDYRANEITFSQITQLIGRAGRSSLPGRAVIQTFSPDSPVIKLAAAQDYDTFYKNEIALRRALLFPPFCDILTASFLSTSESLCRRMALKFLTLLSEKRHSLFPDIALDIFGPFEAPVFKINDRYRMCCVIKCKNNSKTRKLFSSILSDFSSSVRGSVTLSLDMNPNSI